jgi:hypothetical protein
MLRRAGIDLNAATGGAGFVASVVVGHYSELVGALAAGTTAAYMALRAAREWVKLRRDLRAKELKDESKNE